MWPVTIFNCIIGLGKPIWTQIPCQGCPGQGAYLTSPGHCIGSMSCVGGCPQRAPWAPLKHMVAICASWTQSGTVCRSLVWPWMTSTRLSSQILYWVLWLLDCRTELWASISLNWLILLNANSSFMNATTSNWGGAFCIGRPYPKNPNRPYSNCSC